jgi:hypothetical protein
VFNATFSSISAISWRPVLVVEEAEYPEGTTDHGQATGNLYHMRLRVECTFFEKLLLVKQKVSKKLLSLITIFIIMTLQFVV